MWPSALMTLSITDTQHNNALYYAECPYAKCRVLFTVLVSVIRLNVVMLSVVGPYQPARQTTHPSTC